MRIVNESACTTKDLWAHTGVPGEAYRDSPPWVLCRDKVGPPCVAIRVFSVATMVLHCELVLCRDSGTFV